MKDGTVSDHNLVSKLEEQLVNQILNCQGINRSQNKVIDIEVEGADIYGEYIDRYLANAQVGGSIEGIHGPSSLDSKEMLHNLQNEEVAKEYENGTKVNKNVTKCVENVVQTVSFNLNNSDDVLKAKDILDSEKINCKLECTENLSNNEQSMKSIQGS